MTRETLYRRLYDHYTEHVKDGAIDVNSLEQALAKAFDGTPNPSLHEFVVNFCLDIQEVAQQAARTEGK